MPNEVPIYISAPLLTTLLIEAIKWVIRKWIVKNPTFDFAPIFYQLAIPFFTACWGIVLGLIGWADPVVFEWQTLLKWALGIIVTLVLYNAGIKPLKEYGAQYTLDNR